MCLDPDPNQQEVWIRINWFRIRYTDLYFVDPRVATVQSKGKTYLIDLCFAPASPLLPTHGLKLGLSHLAAFCPRLGQLAYQQVLQVDKVKNYSYRCCEDCNLEGYKEMSSISADQ